MNGNIGDIRNLFFRLKSRKVFYHVLHTTPKISTKFTPTVIEMQPLRDIEKKDSEEEVSFLE